MSKIIYNYSNKDGILLSNDLADLSPLEEGVYLIPANATDIEPLEKVDGKTIHFVNGVWEYQNIPQVLIEPLVESIIEIPNSINMKQYRLALLNAGHLDDVELYMSSMSKADQINWEFSTTVKRDDPLVLSIATLLNLDNVALDALFTAAALL